MTTLQYLQRVARRTRDGDFTRLALTEQMDVLEAANAALQRLYNALPAYLRAQTQGFTLPAPITLNNVSVTSGSTAVSTGLFSAAQIGATVIIPGDPSWNQVLGRQSLRNPYLGPTGTVNEVMVYGDWLFSTSYPFDRIIGNPMFSDQSLAPLIPMEMSRAAGEWNYLFQDTIGRPMCWWVQFMGNSQGNEPLMVIKFAPLPDMAYSINIRLSFWPMRLLLTDIQGATTLNVPDQFLEKCLIPMAIQELMTKPCFKSISPADDNRLEERGNEGQSFAELQVADPTSPSNRIYCPLGY
jgi:hypothetical protein